MEHPPASRQDECMYFTIRRTYKWKRRESNPRVPCVLCITISSLAPHEEGAPLDIGLDRCPVLFAGCYQPTFDYEMPDIAASVVFPESFCSQADSARSRLFRPRQVEELRSEHSLNRETSGRSAYHCQLLALAFRCADRCMIALTRHEVEAIRSHVCSDAFRTMGLSPCGWYYGA